MECPTGAYSSVYGASKCVTCTNCTLPSAPMTQQCPFSPVSQHCARSFKEQCRADRDATCMMCPIPTHALEDNELCVACKNGYLYNYTEPVEGLRCVQCLAGYFCPSKEMVYECHGRKIFKRGSAYVTVPTSVPGSTQSTDCTCTSAGGFEGSSSAGLLGCQPCADGHYSAVGASAGSVCQPCPLGSYARQTVGLRDYRLCPSVDSPPVEQTTQSMLCSGSQVSYSSSPKP